jgi:hypothetical protein
MKKKYTILFVFLTFSILVSAQNTVTYILDSNDEDATIDNYNPGNNYSNEMEYASRAWTISGTPVTWRSLFKFNLSCLPSNATIINASLSLYHATINSFGNGQHSSLTSSNESVLQRVTTPWSENTVTWNNQPASTATDQVILSQSTSGTQDYLNLDVTGMVQQMIISPSANLGFMLRLTTEVEYAQMFFASGDNPDPLKHPKLTITYSIPVSNCITLKIDNLGDDAVIDDWAPANNNPDEIESYSRAWTINGAPVIWRSLFKFNIPCDLTAVTVQSANLSLFYATINSYGNAQHSSLTSSNESVIQRITSAWTENTITWNNQPSSTSADQVILPQSTSGTQDYLNIDVTAMVQQMINNPATDYGFLLRLITEVHYSQLLFASGDNPDTSKHPSLQICYTTLTPVNELENIAGISIYPNPSPGIINISSDKVILNGSIELFDALGKLLLSEKIINEKQKVLSLTDLVAGIYFIRIYNGENYHFSRVLIE